MRRFPENKHRKYDDSYEYHFGRSSILSPKKHGVDFTCLQVSDESGCRSWLSVLKGTNEDGTYFDPNHRRLESRLKILRESVSEIEQQCRAAKQQALAEGRLKVPTDNPECNNVWLIEVARLDVLEAEINELESRIKKFEEMKKMREDDSLKRRLRHPRGGARLDNGKVTEIDSQKVAYVKGTPTIVDPRSPYDGWSVSKYREQIVTPYRHGDGRHRIGGR